MGDPQKALFIYKKENIPEVKVAAPSRAPLANSPGGEFSRVGGLGTLPGRLRGQSPNPPLPARKEEGGVGNLASG